MRINRITMDTHTSPHFSLLPPELSSYCSGPLHCFLVHFSSKMSRKNSLEKVVGDRVQGPEKPDEVVWHLPRACAPDNATISLSLKPMRPKMSRKWSASFLPRPSASGRRPSGRAWLSAARTSFRPARQFWVHG